jgi:phage shock protein A
MIEWLKDIAPLTGILFIVWYVFRYVILNPLNLAIESLRDAIKELRNEIRENEERRQAIEIKLADVDARSRSAHHRIDSLERK